LTKTSKKLILSIYLLSISAQSLLDLIRSIVYNGNSNNLIYQDQINGAIPSVIDIYAVKTDWTKPLKSDAKIELGWKSAFTKTDNEAIYTTTLNGITTPNYQLSNRFLYDEQIHAAYLNTSKKRKKWDFQAGLRGEYTVLDGEQLGNPVVADTSFSRKYLSLFPTFYANYVADEAGQNAWNFSYGKRIERPIFQFLNPFISPLDKFTFYTGNPNLLPTYSHNLSLTYSYKSQINTSLNYSKTIDGINETLEIVNQIYYSRPNNVANADNLSLSIEGSQKLHKYWTINFYNEVGRVKYSGKLYTENLNAKGNFLIAQLTNSFKFNKGWGAELRGNYQSDIVYSQLIVKSFYIVNAAVSKAVFNNKGTVKLAVNDIFYSRRADGIINYLRQTEADWNSKLDTRAVAVAFSYRFGKPTNDKPRYNGSGSETEQQRVKN
jgi:hypothetical protein